MSLHVVRCPECDATGQGVSVYDGSKWVGGVCACCKGKRLVSIKASDLVILEPFEAPQEKTS